MTIGFDSGTPNMARVYDYWLGGKDHYAADRAEAERLLAIYPPLRDLVRENRAFVTQAITWAAGQRIGRFIELGAGLPASPWRAWMPERVLRRREGRVLAGVARTRA